jgi:hypothetical protein
MKNQINDTLEKIFGNYPKPPCTFNIENANIVNLTHLMLAGAYKLFGKITPKTISEKQFDLLKEYMESTGYTIKYEFRETNVKIWFEKYMIQTKCNGSLITNQPFVRSF